MLKKVEVCCFPIMSAGYHDVNKEWKDFYLCYLSVSCTEQLACRSKIKVQLKKK